MLVGWFVCWCDGVGSWICVISDATILLGHAYLGTAQLPTCVPLLCLVLLTSLRDKNPPSTHYFSLLVMSAFHFSVHLDSRCLLRLLRGYDYDQHNHRGGEIEGLDWSSRRSGFPAWASSQSRHSRKGRFFPMSTSLRGVGLLLVFPEISKVIASMREKGGNKVREDESTCD